MGKFINSHNRKILKQFHDKINEVKIIRRKRRKKDNNLVLCDCEKSECPLGNECLEKEMIYEASVVIEGKEHLPPMKYVGLTKTEFKARYRNHLSSFNRIDKRKSSELSEFIWDLKSKNINFIISWKKITSENSYRSEIGRCNLCLREKLEISKLNPKFAINKKS